MDGFGVGIPRKHRIFFGGCRLKMNQILRLMWFYFVGRLTEDDFKSEEVGRSWRILSYICANKLALSKLLTPEF